VIGWELGQPVEDAWEKIEPVIDAIIEWGSKDDLHGMELDDRNRLGVSLLGTGDGLAMD